MTPIRLFLTFLTLTFACFLASCAKPSELKPVVGADGKIINPYPVGTYDHFRAEPSYPKTYDVWKNEALLSSTNSSNSSIVIDEKQQRGLLLNGDEVVMDYPICSGRSSHPTPKGTFPILEKIVDKRSNKYGKIYDAEGAVVNSDADATKDPIPEGGRFEGAAMRYWMRLTWDGVGHHIGPIRRYPASHACIRGPSAVMPIVYSKVKLGTKITVL
jgi:hypothetical protein